MLRTLIQSFKVARLMPIIMPCGGLPQVSLSLLVQPAAHPKQPRCGQSLTNAPSIRRGTGHLEVPKPCLVRECPKISQHTYYYGIQGWAESGKDDLRPPMVFDSPNKPVRPLKAVWISRFAVDMLRDGLIHRSHEVPQRALQDTDDALQTIVFPCSP